MSFLSPSSLSEPFSSSSGDGGLSVMMHFPLTGLMTSSCSFQWLTLVVTASRASTLHSNKNRADILNYRIDEVRGSERRIVYFVQCEVRSHNYAKTKIKRLHIIKIFVLIIIILMFIHYKASWKVLAKSVTPSTS